MNRETYEDYVYGVFMRYVPRLNSTKTLHVHYMNGTDGHFQSTSYSLYSFHSAGYNRMEYNDYNIQHFKDRELKNAVRFVLHNSADDTDTEVWKRNELIYEDKNQVINLNGKYYVIEDLEKLVQCCETIRQIVR